MKKKQQKASRSTILEVLRYVKRYTLGLIASLTFAAIAVVLTLYIPIVIGDAIDLILEPGKVDFAAIRPLLFRVAIASVIVALSQWLLGIINNKITYGVVRDIRNRAFEKLQKLPMSYLDTHPHGEIVSRIITDADQFSDGLLMGFSQLFTGVITILGTLLFMFVINWKIALVVVLVTPLSLFAASFIAKRTYSLFKAQSETRGEQTAYINEIVGNAKVVRAYGREDETIARFGEIHKRMESVSRRAVFSSSIVNYNQLKLPI